MPQFCHDLNWPSIQGFAGDNIFPFLPLLKVRVATSRVRTASGSDRIKQRLTK